MNFDPGVFFSNFDMKNLFQHMGRIVDTDSYDETIQKIKDGLHSRTNSIV